MNLFNFLRQLVEEFLGALWFIFGYFFQHLFHAIGWAAEAITGTIWSVVLWALETVRAKAFEILEGLLEAVGLDFDTSLGPLLYAFQVANNYFPVGESLALLLAYGAFRSQLIIAKFSLKLNPLMG